MRIIQAALATLVLQASQSIAAFTKQDDGLHKAPVCICCDILLDIYSSAKLPMQTLKRSISRLECSRQLPLEIKTHYKRPQEEYKPWMSNALLSPRATFYKSQGHRNSQRTELYSCCQECKNSLSQKGKNPPMFSIANGYTIGVPPKVLKERKRVEMAMLAVNRDMSHVFAYFGGQHKMIRGFHAFFKSDVVHTEASLQSISGIAESSQIACILSGPFTSNQKQKALDDIKIDLTKMQEAYSWLWDNNCVYQSLDRNRRFPDPIVIDET